MGECRRYLISGRVQGVFFRASTRHEARRLNLTGHAANLPDGRVEVLACGRPEDLDRLAEWLRRGPPGARVDKVVAETAEQPAPAGFRIG